MISILGSVSVPSANNTCQRFEGGWDFGAWGTRLDGEEVDG